MGRVITEFGQEVGLCYWDGSAWQKVEAGTLAQEARLKYYDGAAWQNVTQEQLLGFESIVEEALAEASLAAGTNSISGTVVGTGKVWKITRAAIRYTGTVPTQAQIYVAGLASSLFILDQSSPASGVWYPWGGEIYLRQGDFMVARVTGATLNDDLNMHYAGIQMDHP